MAFIVMYFNLSHESLEGGLLLRLINGSDNAAKHFNYLRNVISRQSFEISAKSIKRILHNHLSIIPYQHTLRVELAQSFLNVYENELHPKGNRWNGCYPPKLVPKVLKSQNSNEKSDGHNFVINLDKIFLKNVLQK